jgi:FKBP-type peptidyl-prolyl cis-trans isomerase FklB
MRYTVPALLAIALSANVTAQTEPSDQIEGKSPRMQRSFSYIVGVQTGNHMRKQMPQALNDIDLVALMQGIRESLAGQPPRMDVAEMTFWSGKFMAMLAEREKQKTEQNATNGLAFRAEYAKREGVATTGSGISYRVIKEGNGRQPGIGQRVVVNYRGTTIDGYEFDSSYKRGKPQEFAVRGVMDGWQEILTLMPTGSKWEAVIPPQLAYGEAGAGEIGPNSTLIFEIELIEVK